MKRIKKYLPGILKVLLLSCIVFAACSMNERPENHGIRTDAVSFDLIQK